MRRSDYPLEMVLALGEVDGPLHVYFRRPGEIDVGDRKTGTAFVMFFSPKAPIPPKLSQDHYRFPMQPGGVYRSITALLALLEEELEGRDVTVHFGWPTSSWIDRMAMGVFVANLMRLPKLFSKLHFAIESDAPAPAVAPAARSEAAAQG
jgi:hypothetical protein